MKIKLLILFLAISASLLIHYYSSGFNLIAGGGNYDNGKKLANFHGQTSNVPDEKFSAVLGSTNVLGRTESKRIEVDLTNQMLYAFEGDDKVFEFPVSTGLWGATPTGEFRIWTKLKYTLMAGGSKELGTYYYLPNVPYTMYFYNAEVPKHRGFGLHGTYWHNNFGQPMSHGCVNIRTDNAEKLFYWANPSLQEGQGSVLATEDDPGTRVIIYGEAP